MFFIRLLEIRREFSLWESWVCFINGESHCPTLKCCLGLGQAHTLGIVSVRLIKYHKFTCVFLINTKNLTQTIITVLQNTFLTFFGVAFFWGSNCFPSLQRLPSSGHRCLPMKDNPKKLYNSTCRTENTHPKSKWLMAGSPENGVFP